MQILLISINKFDLYEWVKNIIFEHNLKTNNMKQININGFIYYFSLNATVLQICEYLYSIRFDLGYRPAFIETCDFDIMGTDIIEIKNTEKLFNFVVETIEPIF